MIISSGKVTLWRVGVVYVGLMGRQWIMWFGFKGLIYAQYLRSILLGF